MATKTSTGPSTAERVRSACVRAQDAVLAIEGSDPTVTSVHHLRSNGDVVVAVPHASAAAALAWNSGSGGLPAVLEITDHAPLRLREPVRSLVWLRGTLHAVPDYEARVLADDVASEHPHPGLLDIGHTSVLLRLSLASAVVADSTGAEPVAVDELLNASPDPFWEMETAWLQHLDEDHRDLVDLLVRKLPPYMRTGRVRPLGIDRYGLRLRVEDHTGDRDVWMPFANPVDDAHALSRAIRMLVGCPFLNGLRSGGASNG
ncbi:DUF2470 domain-containing protein [Rhodococcus erythropolis]|uniref:DUF2470 domain-containing protein n=1 Tax=Rhodococcus erythropolis TaxID=1833 RepID=UPI001E5604C6|nr:MULTISPECIES: DUF2470 domain-containing protein [Rhodococcus erythropolis group]MCD2107321.1 DUF2470 domain-containing protein [Rhodococcus qingshengii]MCZ4526984.1 DUF2470 domain-containing protein [Rhodococcus erythropolis]